MTRIREELGWTPVWEGEIHGWARKYIRKNLWRVDSIHSAEDLEQEAYLTFLRVKAAYPRVVEPRHFMALFKTAMANEMTDRARYRQKRLEAIINLEGDVAEVLTDRIGEYTNEGYLNIALSELPDDTKRVLAVFNDPEKLKRLRQKTPRTHIQKLAGLPAKRETILMKLCRVAGVKWHEGMTEELREVLR